MIQIHIKGTEKEVKEITISGHAGYSHAGNDIVCAAVSSIAITSINAILRLDQNAIQYEEDEGFISIKVLKHDKVTVTLITNLIELLIELQNDYKKYIKINKEVSSC